MGRKNPYIKWNEKRTRRHFKWTPEAKERLALLAPNLGDEAIAHELGCTGAAVHRAKYQFGIGRGCGQRKNGIVSDGLVDQVRRLAGKATNIEIANELGLKLSTVEYVRNEYGIRGRAKGRMGIKPQAYWDARSQRGDERAERMLALTEKIGAMRSWLQSVA